MPQFNPDTPQPIPGGGSGAGAGWIGAIAGAGASIYDTYQSSKTSKYNTDKTIAANQAEAEKAYQREIEMWNMMNAYNSPEQQMARYQAAGLNPNLIYGSGSSAGNASNIPKYNPPNINYQYQAAQPGRGIQAVLPALMQVGTWMQQMKYSQKQIESMDTQNLLRTTQEEKLQQLIDYMEKANPQLLAKLGQERELRYYQTQGEASKSKNQEWLQRASMGKLIEQYGSDFAANSEGNLRQPLGGLSAERASQAKYKSASDYSRSKVAEAQAAYSDYGITNPQALIQMVVSGAMSGLLGTPVRIRQNRKDKNDRAERYQRDRMTTHTETYKRGKVNVKSTWKE